MKMIGLSYTSKELREKIYQVGSRQGSVLIVGETGVGKELVADMIVENERQKIRKKPASITTAYEKRNCYDYANNPQLAHSDLFGHVKGAFTGADQKKEGAFGLAKGGVLFLDEIGHLPLEVQGLLLRAVEYGKYRRLGSVHEETVDCRIIAASNVPNGKWWGEMPEKYDVKDTKDHDDAAGTVFGLRKDLYERFDFKIEVPPLRERRDDLIELFLHFADDYSKQEELAQLEHFPLHIVHILLLHRWPGNVRELKNRVREFIIIHKEEKFAGSWLDSRGSGFTYFHDYFSYAWVAAKLNIEPDFWPRIPVRRRFLERLRSDLSRPLIVSLSYRDYVTDLLIHEAKSYGIPTSEARIRQVGLKTDRQNPVDHLLYFAESAKAPWAVRLVQSLLKNQQDSDRVMPEGIRTFTQATSGIVVPRGLSLKDATNHYVTSVYQECGENATEAGRRLRINRQTVPKYIVKACQDDGKPSPDNS